MKRLVQLLVGSAFAFSAFAASAAEMAPDFTLRSSQGVDFKLSDQRGKYVVLEWWNNECPFVRKHYDSKNMQNLQQKWVSKGVQWFTINSSAAGKQGFVGPRAANRIYNEQEMAATAILHDPKGVVGRLYQAQTTPAMYIINPMGELIYRGAIDSIPSTDAEDLAKATNYVDQVLTLATDGKPMTVASTSSYGCAVKY